MRVLLVGGLGLIGYSLCCQLIEEEIDVFALDNVSNEHNDKEERLLQIGRNAFFQYSSLETDYRTKKEKFDVIIYCLYDPIDRQDNMNMGNNIELEKHLKNALDYSRDYGSKFMLVSGSKESGVRLTENDNEKRPFSEKDDGKLYFIQEQLVIEAFKDKGEQFSIVRLNFDDIEIENVNQIKTFHLYQTKEKSIFQMTTSSNGTGEGLGIITDWLQNNWNRED
ncbi:NAD-dependent epimerase/dehydratase family protein [Bacillus luteolus]|uniref:NAD-dependent epimerase/dehydratase family protein n=1 Tax=Litchfieldia luteola TaxID=682179 RepID=A0ABR9QLG6_9BACI|nr:NAD-dependent epimerase/dehydratase family protein [Cytobacillus luteolus]MBE4909352.1 NAD-dependent epimerase/dehydratase family protein [Cytobacillus luteolus]MBP1940748.1 nucleoside-diphosphate-sugar epimerase [Cytobacillus luteolus]